MRIERPHPSAVDTAALPRSSRDLLALLRHRNWIRTADLKRAVRNRNRDRFDKDAKILRNYWLVERRTTDDGLGTEMRLTPTDESPHPAAHTAD
jgi:hypothetical protein